MKLFGLLAVLCFVSVTSGVPIPLHTFRILPAGPATLTFRLCLSPSATETLEFKMIDDATHALIPALSLSDVRDASCWTFAYSWCATSDPLRAYVHASTRPRAVAASLTESVGNWLTAVYAPILDSVHVDRSETPLLNCGANHTRFELPSHEQVAHRPMQRLKDEL